jgi:hypothetical protein
MSKTTDKLIDDIIELILGDMDCHHEVDRDEDGVHTSVEYSLNDETKLRGMIGELIEQSREAIQEPEPTEPLGFLRKFSKEMEKEESK